MYDRRHRRVRDLSCADYYEPFGPVKSWTWGNSTTMSRTYDPDGRVTSMASGGVLSLNPIVYDEASRITGITDTKTSTNSWSYGYDAMDRLSSASKSGTSYGWTYDANGNRKTQTGTSATTYTISTTSNRLTNLSGATTRTYGFDASGNITSYDSWSFTYNKRNRMSGASSGANSTSYVYNALGQMIRKTGSATGLMMYDEAGHLVGEYTSTGTLTQETIWLGDTPVATIRPNGASYDIYYVHTDQIDTPKVISRPSDNKLRWRWDLSSPFGGGAANENPASLGAFSYNLRFPGQFVMSETGNRQNGFRVYESFTGRYMQSDPIGLRAGVNTYSYVGGNPVSRKDPFGLMCTAGLGCYTTPAEAAAAQSGNYQGYYQLACAGGDAYACFAGHVAANDDFWGHRATNRLVDRLRKKAQAAQQCLNEEGILDQIRKDLAKDYASYLPNSPNQARWPSAQDVAQFHWNEFGQFGLPQDTFGGTPYGQNGPPVPLPLFQGPFFLPGTWCPNCTL